MEGRGDQVRANTIEGREEEIREDNHCPTRKEGDKEDERRREGGKEGRKEGRKVNITVWLLEKRTEGRKNV